MILDRLSEPTGPMGGITADGMINVLGRPPFSTLTLVLREAAQNTWDARLRKEDPDAGPPELEVRIRTLSVDEGDAFRRLFSSQAADDEPVASNELARELATGSPIRVLEVCDFGTSGLRGPVDPREPGAAHYNFRNFFFDVGVAHPATGDGGTYGYGRSALYLAGRARTILVDTLAMEVGAPERRFMACRIGHAYERRSFVGGGARFTGRHFWGNRTDDGIEPLVGAPAEEVARALGLPTRDGRGGTSIMIPWPDGHGVTINGRLIIDELLCHLWPKMVSSEGPGAMRFRVLDEGTPVSFPRLATHPVYGLFAAALLSARTRAAEGGAREIRVKDAVTGHLGLEVGAGTDDARAAAGDDTEISGFRSPLDGATRHVALMRPTELVVKYLEVPGARRDGRPWAGVFVCSEEDGVAEAFALAEPPAHDDWIPDRIEDPASKRLVSATVRRQIPAAVRGAFEEASDHADALGAARSFALAADAFAQQFLAGGGTAVAAASRPARPGPGSTANRARLTGPWLEALLVEGGERVARYRLRVTGLRGQRLRLRAHAEIATDATGADLELPQDLIPPEILCWRTATGGIAQKGRETVLHADGESVFDVAFRGRYAIAVRVELAL